MEKCTRTFELVWKGFGSNASAEEMSYRCCGNPVFFVFLCKGVFIWLQFTAKSGGLELCHGATSWGDEVVGDGDGLFDVEDGVPPAGWQVHDLPRQLHELNQRKGVVAGGKCA